MLLSSSSTLSIQPVILSDEYKYVYNLVKEYYRQLRYLTSLIPEANPSTGLICKYLVRSKLYDLISAQRGKIDPVWIKKIITHCKYDEHNVLNFSDAIETAIAYWQDIIDKSNKQIEIINELPVESDPPMGDTCRFSVHDKVYDVIEAKEGIVEYVIIKKVLPECKYKSTLNSFYGESNLCTQAEAKTFALAYWNLQVTKATNKISELEQLTSTPEVAEDEICISFDSTLYLKEAAEHGLIEPVLIGWKSDRCTYIDTLNSYHFNDDLGSHSEAIDEAISYYVDKIQEMNALIIAQE